MVGAQVMLSQEHYQVAEWEVEYLELKTALIRNASIAGGSLIHSATMLVPFFLVLNFKKPRNLFVIYDNN